MSLEDLFNIKNISHKLALEKRPTFEKLNKKYLNIKKGKCLHGNCNNNTINSHSISKNRYLTNICTDDYHVGAYIPMRNLEGKELVWKRVGINDASVFQGFCKQHDNMLFESIDNEGLNDTRNNIIIQCYRTVCWWFYKEKLSSAFIDAIQEKIDDQMRTLTSDIPDFDYDSFRLCNEHKKDKSDDVLGIIQIKNFFEEAITNDIFNFEQRDGYDCYCTKDIEIFFKRVDIELPIALQTMVSTTVGKVFQIVLPDKEYTDLVVINATKSKLFLKDVWESRTKDLLHILGLVESWMIADENWYVRPTVIENLSEEKRNIISDDIRYSSVERKLWQPYDMSIFDDIRKMLLNELSVSPERMKREHDLYNVPIRPDRYQREIKMRKSISEQMFNRTHIGEGINT